MKLWLFMKRRKSSPSSGQQTCQLQKKTGSLTSASKQDCKEKSPAQTERWSVASGASTCCNKNIGGFHIRKAPIEAATESALVAFAFLVAFGNIGPMLPGVCTVHGEIGSAALSTLAFSARFCEDTCHLKIAFPQTLQTDGFGNLKHTT